MYLTVITTINIYNRTTNVLTVKEKSKYLPISYTTLLIIIGKSFVVFSTHIYYKLCSKSLLKELHTIKLLHIEIIDNAGRKKTKLLPIEFINTSHNSVMPVGL